MFECQLCGTIISERSPFCQRCQSIIRQSNWQPQSKTDADYLARRISVEIINEYSDARDQNCRSQLNHFLRSVPYIILTVTVMIVAIGSLLSQDMSGFYAYGALYIALLILYPCISFIPRGIRNIW